MCQAVTCRTCGKASWRGCGQHVDMVLAGVPKSQRCQGHSAEELKAAKDAARAEGGQGGFFAKMFGGR